MPKGYTLLTTFDIWKLLPKDGPGITTEQLATRVRGFTGGDCTRNYLHLRLKKMAETGRVSVQYETLVRGGLRMLVKRGRGASSWVDDRSIRSLVFLQARGWLA